MHNAIFQSTPAKGFAAAERGGSPSARILIVDDEPVNVKILLKILVRAGFPGAVGTSSPEEALALVQQAVPDLILLDQHMPQMDGTQLLERMRPLLTGESYLPVVFLSGDNSPDLRRRALAAGATDFVSKPFDAVEVVLRIGNLLETRRLHLLAKRHSEDLEQRVQRRTAQLEASHRELLERLCRVAAFRDDDTGAHTRRVGLAVRQVALALGVPAADAGIMGEAAELHDIGKVGVPDDVLHKPGPLNDEEMRQMRTHAHIGGAALTGSTNRLLVVGEQIARWHHERWDGGGYPDGLSGEDIPLAARITAVADVADALTHDRPYRRAWTVERTLAELTAQAGRQFDPRVVAAYMTVAASLHAPDPAEGPTA